MIDVLIIFLVGALMFVLGLIFGAVGFFVGQKFGVEGLPKRKLNPPRETPPQEPINPYKNYKPGRAN